MSPIILTIHSVAYVVSAASLWVYNRLAFSPEGRYSSLKPGGYSIFEMFMPFWNLGASVTAWLFFPPLAKDMKSGPKWISKFFGIK